MLRLKRGEERRLAAGHLWVFSNEVDTDRSPLGAFAPGEVVQLHSYRDAFLAYAYVNPHALICARILSRDAAQPVTAGLIELEGTFTQHAPQFGAEGAHDPAADHV